MTFPTISYKYNGIDAAKTLTDVVDAKFSSLAKFLSENDAVLCEVEFEKVASQQHGKIYRVEANLTVNGTLYRAEATEHSFEESIDEVRDELDKEIRRAKDKSDSLRKKAGRAFKRLLSRN